MAFVPFNNVIKIEPVFTYGGVIVENVHYYLVDETPDLDTGISLADDYIASWTNGIRGSIPGTCTLDKIRVTIMENQNDPGLEHFGTTLPLAGTGVGDQLPNNCTVAVKWQTMYRGRSYRGRTYHVGIREVDVNANTLIGAFATTLLSFYQSIMTLTGDVGPCNMVVASRVQNGVLRSQGVATQVVNVSIDPTIDSQRRRLPGRGT